MKKNWTFLAVLCSAVLAFAAEPENLIREPMTITNPATTVLENGVYTIPNPTADTRSMLRYKVVLNQETVTPLSFAVEAKGIENTGNHGCNFGMILNLLHTDNTRTTAVNFGMGKDTFDWRLGQRIYTPKKPVKEVEVQVLFTRIKGKAAFRNPQLYQGAVTVKMK